LAYSYYYIRTIESLINDKSIDCIKNHNSIIKINKITRELYTILHKEVDIMKQKEILHNKVINTKINLNKYLEDQAELDMAISKTMADASRLYGAFIHILTMARVCPICEISMEELGHPGDKK
jgi:hypothetical protein